MDYGRILTRAWEITWRWKFLWVLGFLAALGSGGGGGSPANFRFSGQELGMGGVRMPDNMGAVVVALGCLALILGIVIWVLSVMARGGLIAGVDQIESGGASTLGRAWSVGQRYFWRLFGISVLVALPIIVIAIIAAIIVVGAIGGTAALSGDNINRTIFPALAGLVLCLVPLICVIALLSIVLNLVRLYAERAAVLEDLPWIEAFKRGWAVIRANLGPTLIFWLIFLVIGFILGAVIFGGILALALPFFAVMAGNNGSTPNWLFLPLCGAGLIALIVGSLVGSVVETFTSSTWTLVYRQLTGRSAAAPSTVPETEGPVS